MVQAFNLSGQRVAITGAGGGIGSETARLVASMGADVMVADLEAPEPLADYLRSQGKVSVATALNTTDRKAVEAWAETCGEVDALIDCAAICPFDDWNDDGWDEVAGRVFNVNLQGPLNVTRAFFPGMVARKKGSMVALVTARVVFKHLMVIVHPISIWRVGIAGGWGGVYQGGGGDDAGGFPQALKALGEMLSVVVPEFRIVD